MGLDWSHFVWDCIKIMAAVEIKKAGTMAELSWPRKELLIKSIDEGKE